MILIKNGRYINPADNTDRTCDILIEDSFITNIGEDICKEGAYEIDATGKFIFPGFIDMHSHLRDPGQTHKEDILSGAKSAAKGGFTTVVAMPNTSPVCDNVEIIEYIKNKAKQADVNILPVSSITRGMDGLELTDIDAMVRAGACAISEDGKSVMNAALLRSAMIIAAKNNIPVLSHCEDANLAGGAMNAGERAKELDVPGIEETVEDIIAARDILIAKETGAHLHLCHNSTQNSYKLIELARNIGTNISAEVCPHHFALTDEDIPDAYATNYKMSPPLRSKKTVDVLKEGLSNGIYNVIATDHAPHTEDEKKKHFIDAPNGIIGFETAASITYTVLVEGGLLSPMQMAEKLSYNPARILHLNKGNIGFGKIADITIFDPNAEYVPKAEETLSKSKNSPYYGMKLKGRVTHTLVSGKVVYSND